LSNESWW